MSPDLCIRRAESSEECALYTSGNKRYGQNATNSSRFDTFFRLHNATAVAVRLCCSSAPVPYYPRLPHSFLGLDKFDRNWSTL